MIVRLQTLLPMLVALIYSSVSYSVSFDCAKTTSLSEHSICGIQSLSTLDDQLAIAYRNALLSTKNQRQLEEEAIEWFGTVKTCNGDPNCIERLYRQRIAILTIRATSSTPTNITIANRTAQANTSVVQPQSSQQTINIKYESVYVGQMIINLPNQYDTVTHANGSKYVGEFRNEKRHGQGTLIWLDGSKYVGEFKDDKLNGVGTYVDSDGSKYIGEFRDDKYNGIGNFTWPDGRRYVGEFKDSKKNGQGTFVWPDRTKYVGEFKDDKFNGQGTYTFPDGRKYAGEFRNNDFNGLGTFTWPDGRKYLGEFKDDTPNGIGTLIDAYGKILQAGLIKDGNFVQAQTQQQTTDSEHQRLIERRTAAEQKAKEEAAKRAAAEYLARIAAFERMMNAEAAKQPSAAAGAVRDEYYGDKVRACVQPGVSFAPFTRRDASNPAAQYRVALAPNGQIAEVRLTKSSGDRGFDQAVETGIRRCSPFPRPSVGAYPSNIDINYNMYN